MMMYGAFSRPGPHQAIYVGFQRPERALAHELSRICAWTGRGRDGADTAGRHKLTAGLAKACPLAGRASQHRSNMHQRGDQDDRACSRACQLRS